MRLISSYDSAPIENNRWNNGDKFLDTVYMTALSLLYASKYYSVTFYTNEKMANLLNHLPIEIKIFKRKFDYSVKDTWVESKFYALSEQSAPFVHIDTDVFLYKDVFSKIEDYEVITERMETKSDFHPHYLKQIEFFTKHIVDKNMLWHSSLSHSLNCGTLGFNNLKIKDEFVENYFKLKSSFNTKVNLYRNFCGIHSEPCIIMEQYNLFGILNHFNIEIKTVLKEFEREKQSKEAINLGYTHLSGNVKYDPNIVSRIHTRFKNEFRKEYDIMLRKLPIEPKKHLVGVS